MTCFVARADPAFILTLSAHRATLQAQGAGLRFEADQALRAGDEARLFGHCHRADGHAPQRATLQVAPLPDGDDRGLCVTLRDVAGRLLLGPAVLQRQIPASAAPPDRPDHPAWPRQPTTNSSAVWPAATR